MSVHRQRIDLSDTEPFGARELKLEVDLTGKPGFDSKPGISPPTGHSRNQSGSKPRILGKPGRDDLSVAAPHREP